MGRHAYGGGGGGVILANSSPTNDRVYGRDLWVTEEKFDQANISR